MRVDDFYDRHPISERQVLAAVARRRGGDLSQLSPDDLFELDQDHYGGLRAVDELASRTGITTASHVLSSSTLAGPPAPRGSTAWSGSTGGSASSGATRPRFLSATEASTPA